MKRRWQKVIESLGIWPRDRRVSAFKEISLAVRGNFGLRWFNYVSWWVSYLKCLFAANTTDSSISRSKHKSVPWNVSLIDREGNWRLFTVVQAPSLRRQEKYKYFPINYYCRIPFFRGWHLMSRARLFSCNETESQLSHCKLPSSLHSTSNESDL